MRQTILAAAAAFMIGGIATGAVVSQAQPAPPGGHQIPARADDAPGHHGMGRWTGHHGMDGHGWKHRGERMRAFALIYPKSDRQLASADVQKIAEAFLLWNGNHSWKVADVAPTTDGAIGFSLTTAQGSVVAKFTMDPHSGRIQRVG